MKYKTGDHVILQEGWWAYDNFFVGKIGEVRHILTIPYLNNPEGTRQYLSVVYEETHPNPSYTHYGERNSICTWADRFILAPGSISDNEDGLRLLKKI